MQIIETREWQVSSRYCWMSKDRNVSGKRLSSHRHPALDAGFGFWVARLQSDGKVLAKPRVSDPPGTGATHVVQLK
jgi:hypothetical protein